MQLKFESLIENPLLNSGSYTQIDSIYLHQTLSSHLRTPRSQYEPFVFSCFALSVDGKLCYPDSASGFLIAKNNLSANNEERYADLWSLLLGRTISDAVIIGTNTLLLDPYDAKIDIPELTSLRQNLHKPQNLLHLIITRDCNKINFASEKICQNPDIPLIIYTTKEPKQLPDNFSITDNLSSLNLSPTKQIIMTKELNIKKFINKLFNLGIKVIINESPYHHHQLQQLNLLNEAWINTSGVYIGGNVRSLGQFGRAFNSKIHPHYTILTMHRIAYNFVYTRYKISYS